MKIELPDREIEVEVAENILKRGIGLSLRKKGKMLFKFPNEVKIPIDMMLMRRSLNLYFMNKDKEIIHIETAEPWYKLPNKLLHRPEDEYQYLLESFEDLGMEEGDKLSF